VALDPGCAGAWVNLGGIHFARWEYAAAIEANRRAIEAEPALALAHFNEALGHLQLGEPDRAVECLGRVVALEPGHGAAYHHLAIALHAVGEPLEAELCAAYARELGYRASPVSLEALQRAEAAASGDRSAREPQSQG
jgi:tetratricopeptide (TPR) repeat protein